MLRLFHSKIFSTKSFCEFLENIFRRLVRTKILRKAKMQLSPEFDVWSPLLNSSEHVWPDLARLFRIPAILAIFDQIKPNSSQFRPKSSQLASGDGGRIPLDSGAVSTPEVGCCRILAPSRFRRPIITEFR
jgi:hypothetical protein